MHWLFFWAVRTYEINFVSNHLYGNHLYPDHRPFLTIFGRTDLRISLSGAKFDPEADFDVRFAVARQNPRQIAKKQKFSSEIFAPKNFFWRRKIKRPKSFETRSGKVSRRSEPSLTGKRPFKVVSAVAKSLDTVTDD